MATIIRSSRRRPVEQPHPGFARLTLSVQEFLDAVPAAAVAVDEQGNVVGLNADLVHQFGYQPEELLGRSIDILVPTALRSSHAAMRWEYFGSGQSRTMGAGRALSGQRKDGSVFPIEVGLRALETGSGRLVLAVVSDRSDHLRALASEAQENALSLELAHQEVVSREMGHRVKNLMATVAALVSLSARGAQTPKEMEGSLRGRILALSSVIDMAFKSPQAPSVRGALTVGEILQAVLAPFRWTNGESDRVLLSGPPLMVDQRPSEILALVFHELTTNALKYGALQKAEGRLVVDWQQRDDRLELCWREQTLPFQTADSGTKGFGTTLMSRLVEGELGGRIDRDKAANGWTTCLSISLSSLGQ